MFDATSRYYSLETRTFETADPDGTPRTLRYCERRFLPAVSSGVTLMEHTVREGDRLDNIAARTLGDPLLFWRIADANSGMSPDTLCDEPGARITIAMPSA
jgi:nucleoid-associated protein YgaU